MHERRAAAARVADPARFGGIVGFRSKAMATTTLAEPAPLRPLVEYEQLIGGRWWWNKILSSPCWPESSSPRSATSSTVVRRGGQPRTDDP